MNLSEITTREEAIKIINEHKDQITNNLISRGFPLETVNETLFNVIPGLDDESLIIMAWTLVVQNLSEEDIKAWSKDFSKNIEEDNGTV